jgi:hypothetical protein
MSRSWIDLWARYWFTEIAPQSYAILRIALGCVGLMGLVGLTPLTMYWMPEALAPAVGGGVGIRPLLMAIGFGEIAGYALYAFLCVSFLCTIAGFLTPVAVGASFIGSALQGFWNPLPLASSHKVLVALLFCLVWADCGRVLSVDAWRRRGRNAKGRDGIQTLAIWPLRLVRIQVGIIYFGSGLTKLLGDLWRDGTAVHYVLHTNAFHRFPTPFPQQLEGLLTAVTYVTVIWELAFFLLILNRRTRVPTLWFGVLMHVGMAITLELGTFSAVMLAAYLAFIDPATAAKWIPAPSGARVLGDRVIRRKEL